jgi:hypothetical protein
MTVKRGKQVSEAEFRRMWNDHSMPAQVIADRLGISVSAVGCRARCRNLPNRPGGKGSGRRLKKELFREMWDANVKPAHIAGFFKVCPENVTKRARIWGFPDRDCHRWNSITMTTFLLARAARVEQAALINAEMVDGDTRRRRAA